MKWDTEMAQTPHSPLQAVHVLRPASPSAMGHGVDWEGDRPFRLGSRLGKRNVATTVLAPSISGFFLRKAQDVVLTGPLEGGVRQAMELKIGRNSSWGEADLFGGLFRGFGLGCWIEEGLPLVGSFAVQKEAQLGQAAGVPSLGPGSLPRAISQLKACQEEDSYQPSRWSNVNWGKVGSLRTLSFTSCLHREP